LLPSERVIHAQNSEMVRPGLLPDAVQGWINQRRMTSLIVLNQGKIVHDIYIDQTKAVVNISTMADRKFREPGVEDQNVAMFRQIAGAL